MLRLLVPVLVFLRKLVHEERQNRFSRGREREKKLATRMNNKPTYKYLSL